MLKSLMFLHLQLNTVLIHVQIVGYHAKASYLQLNSSLAPTVFTSSSARAKHFLSPFSFAQLLSACRFACAPFCCFTLSFVQIASLSSFPFPYTSAASQPISPMLSLALGPPILFCSVKWLSSLSTDGTHTYPEAGFTNNRLYYYIHKGNLPSS